MNIRTWSWLTLIGLGGCAAIARYDGELPDPDEALYHAYHAVRTEGASTAHAGGIVFCATKNGLEATLAEGRSSDQWSARLDQAEVQDSVRGALKADPVLKHEPIHAELVHGEAFLYGKISSDQLATLAVYDALRVMGVASVNAAFLTPESPMPMTKRGPSACGEMNVVTRMR
jgi:hypothetical protein